MTPDTYIVYSDGGCKKPGAPATSAAAILNASGELQLGYGLYQPSGTNNTGELMGVLVGLMGVPDGSKVQLFSDSNYVVEGINTWMHTWKAAGWHKTSSSKPIKNLDLWQSIYSEVSRKEVAASWVPGHSGNPWNEWCDSLCTALRDCFPNNLEPKCVLIESRDFTKDLEKHPQYVAPVPKLRTRARRGSSNSSGGCTDGASDLHQGEE